MHISLVPIASVLLFFSSSPLPPLPHGPIPILLPFAMPGPFLPCQPLVVHSFHCTCETKPCLSFPFAVSILILPTLVGPTMKLHKARLTFFFQLAGIYFIWPFCHLSSVVWPCADSLVGESEERQLRRGHHHCPPWSSGVPVSRLCFPVKPVFLTCQ